MEDNMATKEQLKLKVAQLETINDQLQTEIDSLHELLTQIGFEDGIKSLKEAANEYIKIEQTDDLLDD
jgi:hypothetical protein